MVDWYDRNLQLFLRVTLMFRFGLVLKNKEFIIILSAHKTLMIWQTIYKWKSTPILSILWFCCAVCKLEQDFPSCVPNFRVKIKLSICKNVFPQNAQKWFLEKITPRKNLWIPKKCVSKLWTESHVNIYWPIQNYLQWLLSFQNVI